MTDLKEMKTILKMAAAAQVQKYPQYRGHFDDYVLVRARKDIKSKLGRAFKKDEVAIARPVVYVDQRTLPGGLAKVYNTIVVWSMSNRCDTHVIMDDIQFIEEVNLGLETI